MHLRLRLLACATIALIPGCGDGGEVETTPSEVLSGLTRGAFVDRADRICVQGRKRLILTANRYFGDLPRGSQPSNPAVTRFANREAIPILQRQYGRLRELRPPPGDGRRINRILGLAELGIEQLVADPTLLKRGSGVPPALRRARIRAFRFGLGACGEPIQRPVQGQQLSG
ncbi:MAG: hypothetical protein ACRDKV_08580 [Solirubrobacterales bacterium]